VIDPIVVHACADELEKNAILREAIRFGLKDVPGTPRMVMPRRSLLERASIAERAAQKYEGAVTNPIKRGAEKTVLKHIPEGKVRRAAEKTVGFLAEDPIGTVASNLVPAPGAFAGYQGLKAGARKFINVVDPLSPDVAAHARQLAKS